jgi:hypothetical protein
MFWTYKQIPVDGQLILNDKIGHYIIIEDNFDEQANRRIDNFGIYFNQGEPVSTDGRWPRAVGEGTEEPMIEGQPVVQFIDTEVPVGANVCTILYRTGIWQTYLKK